MRKGNCKDKTKQSAQKLHLCHELRGFLGSLMDTGVIYTLSRYIIITLYLSASLFFTAVASAAGGLSSLAQLPKLERKWIHDYKMTLNLSVHTLSMSRGSHKSDSL